MTRKVAIITGGSQGVEAGLVAGYQERGWAVVATARTLKPSDDPDLVTVEGLCEAALWRRPREERNDGRTGELAGPGVCSARPPGWAAYPALAGRRAPRHPGNGHRAGTAVQLQQQRYRGLSDTVA